MSRLTTAYLLVCPLLGALVLRWTMDPASGLLVGMVVFLVYVCLHVFVVYFNTYLHWEEGLKDGIRLTTYPTVVRWAPPDTGVEE